MAELDARLDSIERRLSAIERTLNAATNETSTSDDNHRRAVRDSSSSEQGHAADEITDNAAAGLPDLSEFSLPSFNLSTATLMAIGAAASFILAGAYFVMLAYEAGWLTPERQVVIAFISGCALIALGQGLATRNRDYAAYLPAVGLTILYLSIYAAHLAYSLIPVPWAIALITVVSVAGLYLGWRFDNSVFAVLTATGVYLTPVLIRAEFNDLLVVVIYFSMWSLMFSFFALQEGRRATYLVALYLALTAFDVTWRLSGTAQWQLAAVYQLVQFSIFAATAAAFSVRHRTPMTNTGALLHGIPLFYFYGLEYLILKTHAPAWVAPSGLSSVIVLIALFLFAKRRMDGDETVRASASLVSTYAAFATAHILFFELLPRDFFAWGVLFLPLGVVFADRRLAWGSAVVVPLMAVGGVLFLCGFVVAILGIGDKPAVAFPNAALLLYGAALYTVYYFTRAKKNLNQLASATLYMGHLSVLITTVRIVDSGLAISICWAIYAVALLVAGLITKTRELGQSSLVIFSASAFKVLIFDLDGSSPGVRIVTLIILGGSLYLGGWLYQNLVRETTPYSDDPALDAALRMIMDLAGRDFDDHRIAAILTRREFASPDQQGWDAARVARIRETHQTG